MKYEVVLYESIYHRLTVDADSRHAALEKAETLVSDTPVEQLERENDYWSDGKYTASYEVYELEMEEN